MKRLSEPKVLLLAAGVLLLPLALNAQAPSAGARADVLIGFRQLPGAAEQQLVRAVGGTIRHTYRIIPAIAATLPQQAVNALRNHPAVVVVEPDAAVHALDEYSSAWGVDKIGARPVHDSGNRGAGLKVCVIDSGIDRTHPDLIANYGGGYDFVNGDSDPSDDNGHGTHVSGTIAAVLNGAGVAGVAPQASILAYKILDAAGSGSFSDAIAAVERCRQDGGRITNNSYGSAGDPGTLVRQAFDNAYNAGILHIAASGNATSIFTCTTVSYPAQYESVVAVGATTSSDGIASFSCRGADVELSAPGSSITSTVPGGGYGLNSGTSMASPHVAGAAALVFNCGQSTNAAVRQRLRDTALDLGTAGRDTAFGFGRVRVDQACNATTGPQAPAAPSGLSVTARSRNSISLRWSDNSGDETGFELERCAGAGCSNFSPIVTLGTNTTAYANSGLTRKTSYTYRVRAVNTAGASAYSNAVTAKTN